MKLTQSKTYSGIYGMHNFRTMIAALVLVPAISTLAEDKRSDLPLPNVQHLIDTHIPGRRQMTRCCTNHTFLRSTHASQNLQA
jgi:hypothetical protein